jgi:hypothetical protein
VDVDANPFRIAGELLRDEMIDRDAEATRLLALAEGGHASRLVAPRRYGKTSLLRRVLREAGDAGWATALVDLEGVLSLSSTVVRIERAYDRSLKGAVRRTVDALFRSWKVGLSLGAGGFTASIQSNPRIDVESVFLRLLDLPRRSSSGRARAASSRSTSSRTCSASAAPTGCCAASSSIRPGSPPTRSPAQRRP